MSSVPAVIPAKSLWREAAELSPTEQIPDFLHDPTVPDVFPAMAVAFSPTVSPALDGSPDSPAPLRSRWQQELVDAWRSPASLLKHLGLTADNFPNAVAESTAFPCLVPRSYVDRMEPGNPQDPLLLQVLPFEQESQLTPGFVDDAVDDSAAVRAPGLLQKYHGRVLLITTAACAIHCRYCFRREFPYHESPGSVAQWTPAFDTIRDDGSIQEVILSGGDPLMLTDARLAEVIRILDSIPHVERVRIHSRLPIVLPSRVTPELIELLTSLRAQPILVVHANHAREIVGDCEVALRALVRGGMPVLNQTVLLVVDRYDDGKRCIAGNGRVWLVH